MFFKNLLASLYQRIFVAYKSTLLGLALIAATEVANAFQLSTSPVLHVIGLVLGAVLVAMKPKLPATPPAVL